MSTADAVTREAAWLASYNAADGMPALHVDQGGPFAVVQPYRRRTPPARSNQLYVTRTGIRVERFGFNRLIAHYQFTLRIYWPLSSRAGDAESVQQNLDDAVDLVLQRITGPLALPMDKTHGARFMSVAEDPCVIDVQFPPVSTVEPNPVLEALITYAADDKDYLG